MDIMHLYLSLTLSLRGGVIEIEVKVLIKEDTFIVKLEIKIKKKIKQHQQPKYSAFIIHNYQLGISLPNIQRSSYITTKYSAFIIYHY